MRCVARRGVTMMEVVVSIALVGITLTASLSAVGGAARSRALAAEQAKGAVLVASLLDEIGSQWYHDQITGRAAFGLPASEVGDGSRALFDDVDDYNGWKSSPPQDKDGTPIDWATGLMRSVQVSPVRASDLSEVAPGADDLKIVVVEVSRDGRLVHSGSILRGLAWDSFRGERR